MNTDKYKNINWKRKLKGTPYKTPAEYVKAVYKDLGSLKAAAKFLKVSMYTISYYLHYNKSNTPGRPGTYKQAIMAIPNNRRMKMTAEEIAAEVGCSVQNVRYICNHNQIVHRRKQRTDVLPHRTVNRSTGVVRHRVEGEDDLTYVMEGEYLGRHCIDCGCKLYGRQWRWRCPVCKARWAAMATPAIEEHAVMGGMATFE